MNNTRLRWWAVALLGATTLGVLAIITATGLGGGWPTASPTPSSTAEPSAEPTAEPTVPTVAVELSGTLLALPDSGTDGVFHLQIGTDTLLPVTVPPELDAITDQPVHVTVLVPDTLDLSGSETDRVSAILTYLNGERGRTIDVTDIRR